MTSSLQEVQELGYLFATCSHVTGMLMVVRSKAVVVVCRQVVSDPTEIKILKENGATLVQRLSMDIEQGSGTRRRFLEERHSRTWCTSKQEPKTNNTALFHSTLFIINFPPTNQPCIYLHLLQSQTCSALKRF